MLRRREHLSLWLAGADVSSDQEHAASARKGGSSGRWLLQRSLFRDWFDPAKASEQLLWITGIPGAGE